MVRGVLLPMVVLEHLHALAIFHWQVRRTRDALLDVADHRIGPFGEEHACNQQASTKHGANPHSMGCLESGNLSTESCMRAPFQDAGTVILLPSEASPPCALLTTCRRGRRAQPLQQIWKAGWGGGGGWLAS